MDRNRLWIIGAVVVMVAIAALGWVVGVQPQLDAAAAADAQRATVDATNATNLQTLVGAASRLRETAGSQEPSSPHSTSRCRRTARCRPWSPSSTRWPAAHGVTLAGITVSDAQAYKPVAAPGAGRCTRCRVDGDADAGRRRRTPTTPRLRRRARGRRATGDQPADHAGQLRCHPGRRGR